MDRRNFIETMLASAGVLAVDPERLLYVPGHKKIFIPVPSPKWYHIVFHWDGRHVVSTVSTLESRIDEFMIWSDELGVQINMESNPTELGDLTSGSIPSLDPATFTWHARVPLSTGHSNRQITRAYSEYLGSRYGTRKTQNDIEYSL